MDAVGKHLSSLQAAGIQIDSFNPDAQYDQVVLHVVNPTDKDEAYLTDLFGSNEIRIVSSAYSTAQVNFATRVSDNAPWNGGDFAYGVDVDGDLSSCTAGPPGYRQSDGRQLIIEAGHCFPDGATVINKRFHSNGPADGGGGTIGYANLSDYNVSGGMDVTVIDTQNYGGDSNLDWRSNTVSAQQQNWFNPVKNASACMSGAYDTEHCGYTITDVDVCKVIPGGADVTNRCHYTRAVNYNGLWVGSGDSGGPVYSADPNTLKLGVMGIISFGTDDQGGANLYPCPNKTAIDYRYCAHIVYFTDIVPILNKYGMALNR